MTLPTRDDGGIDWGKLEAATPIMISSAAMRVLGEQIAAYERERCAKWHEEQQTANIKLMRNAPSRADYARFEARAYQHFESATALRKMED